MKKLKSIQLGIRNMQPSTIEEFFYLLLLAASRLTLVLSQEDHLAHPMLIGAILNF